MPPRTYTDEQFINAVNELKIASTGDIAKIVGCKPRNASIRLDRLHGKGEISKMNVGERWIWTPVKTEATE